VIVKKVKVDQMDSSSEYTTVIKPSKGGVHIDFVELWHYRDLIGLLVKRDIYGRYRQSALGFMWAFIPAVMQMVVFSFIFGRVAKLGPEGIPYPVFSFAALLPWTYFSRALTSSGNSLIGSKNLISKVYFPRMVLPLTGVVGSLVDFAISLVIMFGLMVWFGVYPGWEIVMLPVFLLISLLTALGVGFWLTALSVKYRDVIFVTPFLIQIGMYVTPVIYSLEKLPAKFSTFIWLNPMTGVVEGFRWALLGQTIPRWDLMLLSIGIVVIVLVTGILYFRRTERTLADIV